MKPLTIQGIVLVLMLVALPLASLGTTNDTAWLSIAALAVFGLAALTPPVMRFVGDDEDEDDDEHGEQDEAGPNQDDDAAEEER